MKLKTGKRYKLHKVQQETGLSFLKANCLAAGLRKQFKFPHFVIIRRFKRGEGHIVRVYRLLEFY